MALNIQAGARSLIQVGLSISDVGALVHIARSIGNWLRVTPNDEDLFDSLSEDYGVVLRRRGLVDLTLMENCWSRQLHLIHEGVIVHDTAESRKEEEGQLGSFSWLMVAIVTALDPCLTTDELRTILIDLFIILLRRDDSQDVRDSLRMQIQTNIESWRSTGVVRGMKPLVDSTLKDCRSSLGGGSAIPALTRAENQELLDFLTWLMAGDTDHFSLVSATLYSVAAALQCAKIQLTLGRSDQTIEGQIVVQYAAEKGGLESLLDALKSDWKLCQTGEGMNSVPPTRVSYLSGKPEQMIQTFPCSRPVKNQLETFWFRGSEAAAKVSLKAVCRLRLTGIKYIVKDYDECTSQWPGRLTDLSSEHFPVDSETLLVALDALMKCFPEQIEDWLYKSVKLDGGINEQDRKFTEEQMNAFLCFQSLVFGYWYQLLKPWVSMEYVKHEVYFYGVWGYRDTYLLVMLRAAATHFRLGLARPHDGLSREELLHVLAAMFAGRAKHNVHRPRKKSVILTHGMVAVLDQISIVAMSLLKPSDQAQQQARFAVLSLPLVTLVPDRDGELWTGDAAGIQFRTCANASQQLTRRVPREEWSVHPKMTTIDGRLSGVVLMVRCGGVAVGILNPDDADATLLRAQENRTGHLGSKEPGIGPPQSFLDTFEEHFQKGAVFRPISRGDLVLVHSNGSPVMRYAAAGFYAKEAHIVVAFPNCQDAVHAIREQMCGRSTTCGYGVIID